MDINEKKLVETAKQEGFHRFVVGAAIVQDAQILLLKRPENDFMGGIYELPSGKVEAEEVLSEALFREVKEETSLEILNIERYLGHFDYQSKSGKQTRQFNFQITVKTPVEIVLTEHEAFAWVSHQQLVDYAVTESVQKILQQLFV